jgi:hypothetical protein
MVVAMNISINACIILVRRSNSQPRHQVLYNGAGAPHSPIRLLVLAEDS